MPEHPPLHPMHRIKHTHKPYLGLETPSNGRPHVVNRNDDISLDADAQRENHLSLLDPVFSGEYPADLADRMWLNLLRCQHFKQPIPHPLVLLRGAEDLCLADEDVAERTTAAALLVEAGDGTHGEGFDH